MNNILIIINTARFSYHSYILSALTENMSFNETNTKIIDIGNSNLVTLGQYISSLNPEIIITLDLAGFEIRTYTEECFFNILSAKICNIIWGDKPEYSKVLNGKLSLSMLFYDACGRDNQLFSKYPYLRYYYPTSREIAVNASDFTQSHKILKEIWEHFTKEVLM